MHFYRLNEHFAVHKWFHVDHTRTGKYTYQDDVTTQKMSEVCMENFDPMFDSIARAGGMSFKSLFFTVAVYFALRLFLRVFTSSLPVETSYDLISALNGDANSIPRHCSVWL